MNATARNLPDADELRDTVVYDHGDSDSSFDVHGQAGANRPTGSSDMPTTTAQSQNRYTFNSGARPLDGYTIKRAIGRGGFGEVYYATSDSGKEVALKHILRNLDVECRGVSQCMNLKCPNLLTIYDLKTNDAGEAFVVMEYVAGPSLANVLAEHPNGLPVAEIRSWMRGLVEGVAYLHDHGIVHRDLKPANLFMEEGLVKIGDYGLAKLITPSHGTEHSESIGTCHYMAPEISSGKYNKPIDVYAIGIILYEMLTGHVPFEGETVGEVLMKHLTSRPDVSMLAEPYRSIVARALAKDPALRPKHLYDLLPADDAPRAPGMRFIGDGKTAPTLPENPAPAAAAPKKPDDDVLRIGAEDSVFYIGPDTRPPRPARPPLTDRMRAGLNALRRPPQPPPTPPRPQARPQPQPQPQPRRRPVPTPPPVVLRPVTPPPPPPEPQALPSARVRFAELTSSLFFAAPMVAALTFAASAVNEFDLSRPESAAFLFGTSLLATWSVLLTGKLMEGRAESFLKRATFVGAAALVGVGSSALAIVFDIGPWGTQAVVTDGNFLPTATACYFAALAALGGWSNLTPRDRKARFRIWSLVRNGAAGALLIPLARMGVVGYPPAFGISTALITAVAVQAVSPWNKQAAAYARYAVRLARAERRGRRANVA